MDVIVIGIDGGGTKTRIIAEIEKSHSIVVDVGPTVLSAMTPEQIRNALEEGKNRILSSAGATETDIAAVAAGLAGVDYRVPETLSFARDLLKAVFPHSRIRVEQDVVAALYGAFGISSGALLVGGTGSVAVGRDNNGKIHIVGGWGHLFGDEGSGFYIGQMAMRYACAFVDGRIENTILPEMILKKTGEPSIPILAMKIYLKDREWKRFAASLAPVVLEAAANNDPIAAKIIDDASTALSQLAIKILQITSANRLAFAGGLLRSKEYPWFAQTVREKIAKEMSFSYINDVLPPEVGGLLMAYETFGDNVGEEYKRLLRVSSNR
ncbi:MAG: BadF/BadG/BcrA/BcrD ATPase family protein [Candidatus Korarchaeota archaeon]